MSTEKKVEGAPQHVPIYVPANVLPPQYAVQVPPAQPEHVRVISYNAPGMKRPFGSFMDFIWGLIFGSIAPFWSQLVAHSFETSRMLRIGSWFGTANVVFVAGILVFTMGLASPHGTTCHSVPPVMDLHAPSNNTMADAIPDIAQEECYSYGAGFWIVAAIGLVMFIVGVVIMKTASRQFHTFLMEYQHAELEAHEAVIVTSPVGSRKDYVISFVLALFFGFLAGVIRLRCNGSLQSKHGIMKGIACQGLLWAAFTPFQCVGYVLPIVLIFYQIVDVHFRRALVCAGEPVPTCGWRRRNNNSDNVSINA